jgi:hypothetical protein
MKSATFDLTAKVSGDDGSRLRKAGRSAAPGDAAEAPDRALSIEGAHGDQDAAGV